MIDETVPTVSRTDPAISTSPDKPERRIPVLHPVFFAAFPVLQLFQANSSEVTWSQVWAPLGISILAAVVLLLVARAAFKPFQRAGLLASAIVVLFFSYGPVSDLLEGHKLLGVDVGSDTFLLSVWGLLAVVALLITWRIRRPKNSTKILNAIAGVLLLTALIPLSAHVLPRSSLSAEMTGPLRDTTPVPGAVIQKRDIFYLVVEDYGSNDTLKEIWKYDNSSFTRQLQSLGFYVAEDSLANYPNTAMSLAASFNLDYLSELLNHPKKILTVISSGLLKGPRAARYLKAQGYKYVHIGEWWEPTRKDPFADVNFDFDPLSEFSQTLLEETVAWPIAERLGVGEGLIDRARSTFEGISYQVEKTIQARSMFDEPTFVFTHIPIPHPPYVFNRDGSYSPVEEVRKKGQRKAFLDQLVYTNTVIVDLLKKLLSGPEATRPIVILQTDEGPTRHLLGVKHIALKNAKWSQLRWKYPILNAFYMPGLKEDHLYPTISPVNTFRLIFNNYLGSEFPLLPDKSFIFPDWEHNYDFIDITKRLREP